MSSQQLALAEKLVNGVRAWNERATEQLIAMLRRTDGGERAAAQVIAPLLMEATTGGIMLINAEGVRAIAEATKDWSTAQWIAAHDLRVNLRMRQDEISEADL